MGPGPDIPQCCVAIETEVRALFGSDELDAREDSGSFGGSIEQRIVEAWPDLCAQQGWKAESRPGKRTIYDVACVASGTRLGLDIKTADIDSEKYSDGGLCSVDHLLRFLAGKEAKKRGVLIVLEITHRRGSGPGKRTIANVVAAPISAVPVGLIRIENLGTGQVRLDEPLGQSTLDWHRTTDAFLEGFVSLAQEHYGRVEKDAQRRRSALATFAAGGYRDFVAKKAPR